MFAHVEVTRTRWCRRDGRSVLVRRRLLLYAGVALLSPFLTRLVFVSAPSLPLLFREAASPSPRRSPAASGSDIYAEQWEAKEQQLREMEARLSAVVEEKVRRPVGLSLRAPKVRKSG